MNYKDIQYMMTLILDIYNLGRFSINKYYYNLRMFKHGSNKQNFINLKQNYKVLEYNMEVKL